MKRLLIAIALIVALPVYAEMARDEKTGKLYSKGASKDVNQEEYHILMSNFLIKTQHYRTDEQFEPELLCLKLINTPASLRVIHDFWLLAKELHSIRQQLRNLKKYY